MLRSAQWIGSRMPWTFQIFFRHFAPANGKYTVYLYTYVFEKEIEIWSFK